MSLDARDAMALRVALPAAMVARIGRIDCVAQVDSTNAELLRRGAAQPDLAVLLADAQSAGRGRRGRHWQSPPGANLYASLYWRHRREAQALGGLSVVVGLACAEALQALGIAAVRVKWPNDLIAQGRKLGLCLRGSAQLAKRVAQGRPNTMGEGQHRRDQRGRPHTYITQHAGLVEGNQQNRHQEQGRHNNG